ncbi:MAG: hypothetical protein GYB67_03370 [Chloroflexi bacterium]|nr:hypothetical protein [Chloroflexota bacterium]
MTTPTLHDQQDRFELNPFEDTVLHQLLVRTNRLQALPALVIVGVIAVLTLIVGLVWVQQPGRDANGLIAAAAFALTAGVNWLSLLLLPRAGRSFGPDKPSALALALLFGLLLVIFGLLNAPLALMLIVLAAITGLAVYATWIEPFALGVTRERYASAAWAGAPLRVLHISDLHLERRTRREDRLNALIAELEPDVIVFTGDFVNISYTFDAQAEADIRAVISGWRAKYGTYCVPGTPVVEPPERVRAFTHGLENITVLNNRWVTITTGDGDQLHILGMITTHDMAADRAALATMMASAPGDGVRLQIMHTPDLAPEAADAGLDLYFAGHTHGGQIRLPVIGAVFSASHLGMRFVMGRKPAGGLTVYTSRGVGLEGLGAPRARLLCPPEIILWEISGAAAERA